jgi:hypothetical protein
MHISDRIEIELAAQGWSKEDCGGTRARRFNKAMPTGGEFGRAKTFLEICERGRWLERQDGWGSCEREIDLRDFRDDAQAAIAAVLA